MADESTGTVLLAGLANLVIAIAKFAVGFLSGSSALLSEAAHSLGDTMNEVFLMAALRKSQKPADELHPFGYGMQRYFWSLLAAVGIFVLGAEFSAYEGVQALTGSGESQSALWAFVVLGFAFCFEGTSFVRGVWQLRRNAADAGEGMLDHLLHEADPALRQVVWEDGAALIGLVLAAAGIALDQATGGSTYNGIASLAIAALLVAVAYGLGRQNQQYLIGKSAGRDLRDGIGQEIVGTHGIDGVLELLTMRFSPEQVLVAARVDLADDFSADQLERAADEVDRRIRKRFPEVRHVFLDPTAPSAARDTDRR